MAREVLLISALHGWCLEVALAQFAIWLTIILVTCEVWNFSKLRHGSVRRKVAIDGLLDMLLLPVDIGFFCALCVRVLKLDSDSAMGKMVSTVIESSDIYEAFALWSVLELFVKVVHAETTKDPHQDADAVNSFRSFKSISLQGVKAWVFIQSAAAAFKLVLHGVVVVYVPSLCFWAFQTCHTCTELYEDNVSIAVTAVIFLLCSFAILFVFYFESGYRSHLRMIEPMWKFLGVKGIVSVTYFQFLVISILAAPLGWDDTTVYLLHCLLYAFWMPILAMFHMVLAYPFSSWRKNGSDQAISPWLTSWLRTLHVAEGSNSGHHVSRQDNADEVGEDVEDEAPDQCSSEQDIELSVTSAGTDVTERELAKLIGAAELSYCCTLLYFFVWALCCCASVWCVLKLLPLQVETAVRVPLHTFTCTGGGDLAHFLHTRTDLHFVLLNDTVARWTRPGIAGTWLPLCSSTPVGCGLGHYAKDDLPSVTCSAQGQYSWQGTCNSISCGASPRLPHALPRISDVLLQNWTYGVTVHYDCQKPGFTGTLKAECNISGIWSVQGDCEEVHCGPPPLDIPHAAPVLNPNRTEDISTGMVIRYQCDAGYNGTPTATCGDDGMYVTGGRCRQECGPPPMLPHATPNYDNMYALSGWIEGMRVPYLCDDGYTGFTVAICGAGGNYSTAGECKADTSTTEEINKEEPDVESDSLQESVTTLKAVIGVENSMLVVALILWFWRMRCHGTRTPRNGALKDMTDGANQCCGRGGFPIGRTESSSGG